MGLLNKLGIAIGGHSPREGARLPVQGRNGSNGHTGAVAAGAHREPEMQETTRISNGLKEFLVEPGRFGTRHPSGPWAGVANDAEFFHRAGFPSHFRRHIAGLVGVPVAGIGEEQGSIDGGRLCAAHAGGAGKEISGGKSSVSGLPRSMRCCCGIRWTIWSLQWCKPMVSHLTEMLRPGGVVLAMFHSKKPEGFQRYRVMDTNTLQVLEHQADSAGAEAACKTAKFRNCSDASGR